MLSVALADGAKQAIFGRALVLPCKVLALPARFTLVGEPIKRTLNAALRAFPRLNVVFVMNWQGPLDLDIDLDIDIAFAVF